ncbi:MAG: TadE/TadG family type IV pilus assembly protein [Anaerolineae bacterium]
MRNKAAFIQRAQRLEKGQSLVEMAVGFVILVIILGGLLDLGRVYFIYLALEDGAGEGAIYLAINPSCRTAADGAAFTPNPCANPNNAEYRALNSGGDMVEWSSADVTVKRTYNCDLPEPATYGVGEKVCVRLSYQFPLLTPIIPPIAGVNPLTLTVTATQTIIAE